MVSSSFLRPLSVLEKWENETTVKNTPPPGSPPSSSTPGPPTDPQAIDHLADDASPFEETAANAERFVAYKTNP